MQLLTRLNAGTVNFEGVSGGIPELTTSDIAAALNGANEAGLKLLIAQVCGTGEYKALYALFIPEVHRLGVRLKWRTDAITRARTGKLLDIVLSESILSRKCPSCHGTKYSFINPAEFCPTCKGTGLTQNFDYLKARILGISDRAWRKTWKEREKDIQALLDRRAYQAKRKIIINLYGESDA